MKLLLLFIVMNILNVVIQTVKSLATIKCGKTTAASVNAIAYGLYTYIVVLTMCDLPLLAKCLIVALCNFIGVFVVKYLEEKARKDRLWKLELAIPYGKATTAHENLKDFNIPHNFVYVGGWCMFNCYCMTQKDTTNALNIAKTLGGKYSAYESKT